MPQETSTCSPKEIVSTRKIASQWSTAFPSIKLFPLHGFINVSFFGAPQNLCIYRYMVQLWLDGVLLVEEIIVSQDDLRMDENRNLIGSAIFEKAEHGKNYSIKVTPFEYSEFDHLCVCQYDETRETCDCVAVQSEPFVFSLNESHFQHPQKTFPNEIQLEITTTKEKSPTETRFYIVLATILGFLTLIFILLLVWTISKRTCPSNKFKKNYMLVNQMNKGGQGPLIRQSKYKSILILDVDPFGKAMSELLAQQLEAEGIKVRFVPWEKSIIEENKFQWILQVQHEVNKILLFHSHHARQVIEDQGAGRVMLDDIFYNLISMLGFNDNRIIHTCWENSKDLLLPSTETMYVLPRDISFLFNALDIAPNEIFFAQFKKMMYKQEVSPTQSIASTDLSSEATQEVTSLVESTEDEETCPLVNGTKIVVDETEKEKAQFSKKPVNENIHDSGFQENDSHLISIAW
uniref:SEFIR domain-containing protein n=1 Tax=Acrobeloides nanus TaxID=290746 RepID=A0A914DEX5_9BILA